MVKQFYMTHRPYQMLPLQVRVDLGAIALKEYSQFPKASKQKPAHQMISVISGHSFSGVLLTYRDAVSVFLTKLNTLMCCAGSFYCSHKL